LRHSRTRILPYTPEQLFALVGEMERYPEFIPWIGGLRTWNRRRDGEGVETLDAEVKVRFAIISEKFSTWVRLDRPGLTIDVGLISGPFRKLENHWRFKSHPEGAELTFDIDFEVSSRLIEGLLNANLHKAVARLVRCFEDRARALYG